MKATKHPSLISPKGRRMFKLIALLMLLLPFGKAGMGYAQIITTVAGNGIAGYSGDGGQATNAELFGPQGLTLDALGNIYIADYWNNCIRKVNTAGIISTIAGNYTSPISYGGDGGQATAAELSYPWGLAIDALGNLYIADSDNNRIRKVNTLGIITTIAGNGLQGNNGDGGQATDAELYLPSGIAIDISGNLFVVDYGNNLIRKVNTLGIITTIAGGGLSGLGDGGQATAAQLLNPEGITLDAFGNLYIADANKQRIRKINTLGIINTIAGNGVGAGTGSGTYSGDGGQSTYAGLSNPVGITFDVVGNYYIADLVNYRVRKVNTLGIINTIIGDGIQGFSGDGGQATAAELYSPYSIAFDAAGNLFIADATNNRIRKVTNVAQAGIEQVANINEQVSIYPNPAATSIQVSLAGNGENLTITITDMLGNAVYHTTTNITQNTIPITELNSGVYIIEISQSTGHSFKRFIKQ